ncbi:MAG: branched-chain amino acid ABC transporter substrate-binding protein [Anaerolineae bacterium]|jgi:branched-chain amino acid transport system substrate-binding protein
MRANLVSKGLGWCLVVTLVLTALLSCGGGDQEPIRIGVQGPITGEWALEGIGFRNAVTLLAEQINQEGGLLGGRQITIVEGDDRGDPDEAGRVAERLVSEGVVAVVGAYNSDATRAAAPIYDQAGVLHITPSSTATNLTEPGYTRFMRVCFLDDRQGLFAAELMAKDLGLEKVALVHDDSMYAKGLAEWTQRYLEEMGATVVHVGTIAPGQRDFGQVIQALQEKGAEAVYFTAYWREAGLLVKQMEAVGLEQVQFVAGNAVNNPEFIQIAGVKAAVGVLITTEPLPQDLTSPEAVSFMADYEARYGVSPQSIWTLMAADAFRLIVHAIEETGSTDPAALADYLHDLAGYPGITGTIQGFDEKGDRLGAGHVVYRVNDDGAFVLYR